MAHAQKPDFVFPRNGLVRLNRRGRQFCRLLAAEVCASAVVMLDTPCSKEVWRVLATHSIRQFPLRFSSRASPCAITFQLDSTPDLALSSSVFFVYFGNRAQFEIPNYWPVVTNNSVHFLDYVYMFLAQQPPVGQGLFIHEVSISHTTTQHSR